MSQAIYIYGLCDPRNGELRYIGKSRDPHFRLCEHRYRAKAGCVTRCYTWMRKLYLLDLEPDLLILEECDNDSWDEAERFYIGYFRMIGANLTNHLDGGNLNPTACPEVRKKISAAGKKKKLSPEHKAKLHAGRRITGYVPPSEEGRKRKSEKLKGRSAWNKGIARTDEEKAKMSANRKGKPGPWTKGNVTQEMIERLREMTKTRPSQKGVPNPAVAGWSSKEYIVTSPGGTETRIRNLKAFCTGLGFKVWNFHDVMRGDRETTCGGWKCRRVEQDANPPG